jgi:hypothetical protein
MQKLVALQNPSWYAKLTRKKVFSHDPHFYTVRADIPFGV